MWNALKVAKYHKNNIQLRITKKLLITLTIYMKEQREAGPHLKYSSFLPLTMDPSPALGYTICLFIVTLLPSSWAKLSDSIFWANAGDFHAAWPRLTPCVCVWLHLQAGWWPWIVQPGLLEESKANWPVWELNPRPWLHYHLVKTIEPLSR